MEIFLFFSFRDILFRQLKIIRYSEALYKERQIKPFTLLCIPSSLQLKQRKKKGILL
jgi:hypothetical protein